MTIKTWTKKYYPVSADTRMSKLKAVEHSLRKWEGLREEVLEKHDIGGSNALYDSQGEVFEIGQSTCALCVKYLQPKGSLVNCVTCPLYQTLGCECGDGEDKAPYTAWIQNDDPEPMIQALKDTLRGVKAGKV